MRESKVRSAAANMPGARAGPVAGFPFTFPQHLNERDSFFDDAAHGLGPLLPYEIIRDGALGQEAKTRLRPG